ncbi:hypothetical protein CEY11_13000 [Candidimonas nitroreducens]|uniref:DUF3540 domain-containing protein n=2 Tax=Candidimonas nitroreducens TaxID=683354 RepID=A0A225MGQ2_9BURK|nr:hypothetical protein CEY11_13000 [Candidimonas nitroreducens]
MNIMTNSAMSTVLSTNTTDRAAAYDDSARRIPAAGTQPAGPALRHVRLTVRDGTRYGVGSGAERAWLTTAAGCLLQPAVGDLVLASIEEGRGYILTVLERAKPDDAAEISLPGDLHLHLPAGHLEVTAAQGARLDAGPRLETRAAQWQGDFDGARLQCRALLLSGHALQAHWHSRTEACSGTWFVAAQRGETHLGSGLRRVAGHDEITAQSLRQLVERDWRLQAASADLQAQRRVALRSDSVQLG